MVFVVDPVALPTPLAEPPLCYCTLCAEILATHRNTLTHAKGPEIKPACHVWYTACAAIPTSLFCSLISRLWRTVTLYEINVKCELI